MCGMPAIRDSTGSSDSKEGPYARRVGVHDQLQMLKRIVSFKMVVDDALSKTGELRKSKRRRQRAGREVALTITYELVIELAVPQHRVIRLPKPEDFHGIAITYIVCRGAHVVMPRFVAHDGRITQVDGPSIQLKGRTAILRWNPQIAKTVECPDPGERVAAGKRALFIFEGGAARQFDEHSYSDLGLRLPVNNEKALAINLAV